MRYVIQVLGGIKLSLIGKKHAFLALTFALLSSSFLNAQTQIRGSVIDSKTSDPLIGALVVVKSTTIGGATDIDGQFSFSTTKDLPVTLVVSLLGYRTQEIDVYDADDAIIVQLAESGNLLNELVVVGYGTATRATYTGSVSVVGAKELDKVEVPNLSKALQGSVPGLQSISAAGQPGSDATIFLRGVGSVNASSAPLYVLDGVPYDGNINAINPADVQSISVLKDATASALYGSRGANGVIIITTKKGNIKGKPTVTLASSIGFSSRAIKDYKTLSTNDYFELQWEAIRNNQVDQGKSAADAAAYASAELVGALKINPYGSAYPQPVGLDGKLVAGATPLWNDNWGESLSRTGVRQKIDLTVSGGSENSTYYVSGGYLKDKGFIVGSGFERFTTRANITSKISNLIEFGFGISAGTTQQDAPPQTDSSQGNYANFQRLVSNIYPVYERNADGTYVRDAAGNAVYDYGNYRPSSAATGNNLLGSSKYNLYQTKQDLVSVRGNVQVNILEGLKLKASGNVDYKNQNIHNYTNPLYGSGISTGGSVTKSSARTLGYTLNAFVDYTLRVKELHNFNILFGPESYVFNYSDLSGSRSNFGFLGKEEPVAASLLNSFTGASDNYRLNSFLGKLDYNYNSKYYFSASYRRDGSSRFSSDSRWGNFWSVGASWNVKSESFLASKKWIDNLNLRASYGGQGNDKIGSYYVADGLYNSLNSLGQPGLISSRLPTKDLKWETNLNFNVGADAAFFNSRLIVTVDVYERKSQDLLFSLPIAPSLGYTSIDANIATLRNRGLEFQISGTPITNKTFQWNVDFNLGHFKNKITALPQDEIISGSIGQLGSTKKMVVGGSVYDFFIREWAGVDPATGDPLWYKNEYTTNANGEQVVSGRTTTNVYANADQYFQGSALPDVYGGITNTFKYKNFELSALISYSIGGKILDADEIMIAHNGSSYGKTWSNEALNRWTPENTNTDYPRLNIVTNNWNSLSTRFLYDASYARLKNVNLTYRLPSHIASQLKLKDVRFKLNGENLLTLYGHKGMDPEQAVDGVTYYRYPAQKTYSIGFDITF